MFLERLFRPESRTDVAQADHPAGDRGADAMRRDEPLEDAAILEAEQIGRRHGRIAPQLLRSLLERLGILKIVDDAAQQLVGVADLDGFARNAQHLGEQPVAANDAVIQIEHENAVVRRLERGFEQRDGLFERGVISHGNFAVSMTPHSPGNDPWRSRALVLSACAHTGQRVARSGPLVDLSRETDPR